MLELDVHRWWLGREGSLGVEETRTYRKSCGFLTTSKLPTLIMRVFFHMKLVPLCHGAKHTLGPRDAAGSGGAEALAAATFQLEPGVSAPLAGASTVPSCLSQNQTSQHQKLRLHFRPPSLELIT